MVAESLSIAAGSLLISVCLTGWVRRFVLSRGIVDVPNQRSSHRTPTPRGGGAAIVLASMLGFVALAALELLPRQLFAALAGGGVLIASVGFMDDHRPLPARVRLVVHITAALWTVVWLGPILPLDVVGDVAALRAAAAVVSALGIVWALNLFNFMDGIDGIAASEAAFIVFAGAMLLLPTIGATGVVAASFVLGAACCGFLLWNWPPAKIFMGDVGSGYLGYVIAVLALSSVQRSHVILPIWLILGGVFWVDATVTLLRRLLRGERVYEAHRSHAYQWLARRWGSHKRVTLAVTTLNCLWLLPAAWLAGSFPMWSYPIVVCALAPLVVLALLAGAGRAES